MRVVRFFKNRIMQRSNNNTGSFTLLDDAMIARKLQNGQELFLQCGCVPEIHVGSVSGNPISEDTRNVAIADTGQVFCGVFDGHNGSAASIFLQQELLAFVHSHMNAQPDAPEQAIKEAFKKADAIFLEEVILDNMLTQRHLSEMYQGACAACITVTADGKRIMAANTGDCRSLVGRRSDQGILHAVPVSRDHTCDNPEERQRLHQEHPNETSLIVNNRLKGYLEPTRAFGDAMYKVNVHNLICYI